MSIFLKKRKRKRKQLLNFLHQGNLRLKCQLYLRYYSYSIKFFSFIVLKKLSFNQEVLFDYNSLVNQS